MEVNGRKGRHGLVGNEEAYVKRNHVTASPTPGRELFPFGREWVQERNRQCILSFF